MSDEFEIESEVRDIGDVGQEGPLLPACERQRCCCKCMGEVVCGNEGCGDFALTCKKWVDEGRVEKEPPIRDGVVEEPIPKEVLNAPIYYGVEIEWMIGLMTDKWLLKLRDVIEFRMDKEEYWRNPACHISCGGMRYMQGRIDNELKWRREHGIRIEY